MPEIKDEDFVLRRIPNNIDNYVYDDNIQRRRPSSSWFSDKATNGMEVSVTLENELLSNGRTHQDALCLSNPIHEGFGLGKIGVGFLRNLAIPQEIKPDPTQEDPFHALVIGKKTKKMQRSIAIETEILIEPDLKDAR